MEEDKNVFNAICLLSAYILTKEIAKEKLESDALKEKVLEELIKRISKLEKYAHIPDKRKFALGAVENILSTLHNNKIDEEEFFEKVRELTRSLGQDLKDYVLNSLIFVAFIDNKISDEEKELILQVSNILGYKYTFKQLLSRYKRSEFTSVPKWKYIVVLGVLFIFVVGVVSYFYFQEKNKYNIFKQEKISFNQVSFNRLVVYKNASDNAESHFLKVAVFYLSGTADISVSTAKYDFNPITNTFTLYYSGISPFIIDLDTKKALLVDKIDPQPISPDEAKMIAGGVGLVGSGLGAVAGAKLSGLITSVIPGGTLTHLPVKLISSVAGGVIVGGTSAYIAFKVFDGFRLNNALSETEKTTVIEKGKQLIKLALYESPELQEMYKKNFEAYLTRKYASLGYEVKNVVFEKEAK